MRRICNSHVARLACPGEKLRYHCSLDRSEWVQPQFSVNVGDQQLRLDALRLRHSNGKDLKIGSFSSNVLLSSPMLFNSKKAPFVKVHSGPTPETCIHMPSVRGDSEGRVHQPRETMREAVSDRDRTQSHPMIVQSKSSGLSYNDDCFSPHSS